MNSMAASSIQAGGAKIPKRSTMLIWIGLILVLFSLPFAGVGWVTIRDEQAYTLNGVVAPGTVLEKYIKESWDSDHKSKSKSYIVKYRFTPEGAAAIESSSSVSSGVYAETETGDDIEIQYLSDNTQKNRVAGASELGFGIAFSCVGGLIFIAGALVLRHEIKKRLLNSRLNRNGILVEALIKEVEPGNLYINDVRQWRVAYSYKDMRGQQHDGLSDHFSPQIAETFTPGAKGKVRYDKDDSAVHVFVGL